MPLYCKLPNTISTFIQKEQVTFKVNCSIKFQYIVENATNFIIENEYIYIRWRKFWSLSDKKVKDYLLMIYI